MHSVLSSVEEGYIMSYVYIMADLASLPPHVERAICNFIHIKTIDTEQLSGRALI